MKSVAELSRQMDSERRDLSRNLSELKDRAESALDWSDQVQKHPAVFTAAALGVGMLLAQLGGSRRRSPARANGLISRGTNARDRERDNGSGALAAVGATLKAAAATAAAGMLAEFIPGFREEQERRSAVRSS